jgi:hypothetical protein
VDGALLDNFRLTHGFWEAKDIRDDLPKEARKKFALGYPRDNILFQTPRRALLFQNDTPASPKQRYAQSAWSWTYLDSRGTI